MKNYMFEIDLIFELTGQSMVISFDYETDNPDAILDANWGRDFQDAIFDNISLVPLTYEEV